MCLKLTIETECHFVFVAVHLVSTCHYDLMQLCEPWPWGQNVAFHWPLFETKSVPLDRTCMAQGACRGRQGILAESPPSGPPLPQDLSRTWNQLVSHLQGHKQNRKKYCVLPKGPSFNVTTATTAATTAVRSSGRPAVTVPEFTGAFPAVWTAIFISLFSTPTPETPGSPSFWYRSRNILFSIFLFLFFFNHYWPSNNPKWDNRMSQRPLEPSGQTVWKFTWSHWTAYWI